MKKIFSLIVVLLTICGSVYCSVEECGPEGNNCPDQGGLGAPCIDNSDCTVGNCWESNEPNAPRRTCQLWDSRRNVVLFDASTD